LVRSTVVITRRKPVGVSDFVDDCIGSISIVLPKKIAVKVGQHRRLGQREIPSEMPVYEPDADFRR
jgi:hypothetical protein